MWKCAYRIYPELLLRLPPGSLKVGYREHSVAVEKSAAWRTLTTPSELDWLKRSPGNVHPPQVSLLIQRGDGISRQLSRTVSHGPYVPHRERISNSSSSESKNRSNLSESEKSAKWALKEKRNIKILIYWIFWNISQRKKQFIHQE